MKTIITYILFLIVSTGYLSAQISHHTDSSLLVIPPLTEVIEAAYLHSPLLKAKSKGIEVLGQEIIIEKKKWMDYIFIEGAANYGLYNQLVISNKSTYDNSEGGYLSKNEQIRYYGGMGIKLPLSSASSRRNNIKAKRLSQEQAGYEMLQLQEDIKQLIIEEYYQLIFLQQSMIIFNKVNITLEVSYLKAEKDVINGQMDLNDFALLASTTGKSKNDYLKAKNNFFAQYNKLQSLTGIIFNPKK